jgi:Lon protease-like protein
VILPMFPLGCTLLPGGRLPLHVFEERYRTMVSELLARDHPEFGVVLIVRGSEVGGGEVRGDHGTVARILQCRRFADGRFAMVTGGTTRFAVERWLDDRPYPAAIIRQLDDRPDHGGIGEELSDLRSEVRRLNALAVECGAGTADLEVELTGDSSVDTWRLIDASPLDHHDRHQLLAIDDSDERRRIFRRHLDDVRASLLLRMERDG